MASLYCIRVTAVLKTASHQIQASSRYSLLDTHCKHMSHSLICVPIHPSFHLYTSSLYVQSLRRWNFVFSVKFRASPCLTLHWWLLALRGVKHTHYRWEAIPSIPQDGRRQKNISGTKDHDLADQTQHSKVLCLLKKWLPNFLQCTWFSKPANSQNHHEINKVC